MGGNIVPMLVRDGSAQAYDFLTNEMPGSHRARLPYWRDVGTLDSYFDAHMDMCAIQPLFNLYNDRWPILTYMASLPPAKFVHEVRRPGGPRGQQPGPNGVIVSGGLVRQWCCPRACG